MGTLVTPISVALRCRVEGTASQPDVSRCSETYVPCTADLLGCPEAIRRCQVPGAGVYLADGCQFARPEGVLGRHTFLRWPLRRKSRSPDLNAGRAPLRRRCRCRSGRRTGALNVYC